MTSKEAFTCKIGNNLIYESGLQAVKSRLSSKPTNYEKEIF